MSDQLAEAPLAECVLREQLVEHPIQNARLDADRLTQSSGVVHDDGREDGRDGEERRAQTELSTDGRGEGSDQRGVGAGHAARADHVPEVHPAGTGDVREELGELCEKPGGDGGEENSVFEQVYPLPGSFDALRTGLPRTVGERDAG